MTLADAPHRNTEIDPVLVEVKPVDVASLRGGPLTIAPDTTVALPVFNEASTIRSTLNAIIPFSDAHPQFEFVFVDDGSHDGTPGAISDLISSRQDLRRPKRISLLECKVNGGKGRAISTALELTRSDYFCFLDGDLAYSLDHLLKLRAALQTSQVVIGSRALIAGEDLEVRFTRRVLGRGFNRIARSLLGLPFRDTQAGLKGFRTADARAIFSRLHLTGFAFDAEALYIAHHLGMSIAEIPAHVSEHHRAKQSNVNLITEPPKMLAQLAGIRLRGIQGKYN